MLYVKNENKNYIFKIITTMVENYTSGENNNMFTTRETGYSMCVDENDGSMGILDVIDKEESKDLPVHYYTRIRCSNGCTNLYETEALFQWIIHNPIDPQTRENIFFQKERISQKIKWLNMFNNMKSLDINTNKKVEFLKNYLQNSSVKLTRENARAFVDISTFFEASLIHKDITPKQGKELAGDNKWLLRVSRKHGSVDLAKNIQVVVFVSKKSHVRVAEVDGMGYIIYNGDDLGDPFMYKNKVFTCLIDVLELLTLKLGIEKIVKPGEICEQ